MNKDCDNVIDFCSKLLIAQKIISEATIEEIRKHDLPDDVYVRLFEAIRYLEFAITHYGNTLKKEE